MLDVIHDMVPKQEEFKEPGGSWYNLRISPYRTSENRIEGAVLVLLDISDKRQQRTK